MTMSGTLGSRGTSNATNKALNRMHINDGFTNSIASHFC